MLVNVMFYKKKIFFILIVLFFNSKALASAKENIIQNLKDINNVSFNFILNKEFLLKKINNLDERIVEEKFINFNFIENDNEINIFFDTKTHNLIGWQTLDIYQNLSITYLNSIIKNQKIKKSIFELPNRN